LQTTFSDPAVIKRVKQHYDVIGMNIFSDLEVIDPDGTQTTVKDYAEQRSAWLTPTILFYGVEHVQLLKLVGFYPPEKFSHVLDYIDGSHYTTMQLSAYLRDKTINTKTARKAIIRDTTLFNKPPYDMTTYKGGLVRPMLVVFEAPDCNPCQRFHQRVLTNNAVRKKLQDLYAIQLDASDNTTSVIVPDGRQLTPKQWYDELKLSYDVAVVFFNEQGEEVLRLDAETGRYRMAYTMEYVLEKGYLEEKQVLRWRRKQVQQKTAQTDTGSKS
jgi:thioredoxin-related protein